MTKQNSFFLFLLTCIGCQNITSPNYNGGDEKVLKFEVSYSPEISHTEIKSISGYTSISHFTDAYNQEVHLYEGISTNLVFAVNEYKNPIFASFLSEENTYLFGYEETALTLLSAVSFPFINSEDSKIIPELKQSSDFNTLVGRLKFLSGQNKTFIHDELTHSLLNEISTRLNKEFSAKKDTQSLNFNHEISSSNQFTLTSNTKLPFSINFENSVTKVNSYSLLTGNPLNIENQDAPKTKPAFTTNNGAYELSVKSDLLAFDDRFQKLSRDFILKSYLILGLDKKNYKYNNTAETSVLNTNLPKNPTKFEAINHIRNHFQKELKLFSEHLFVQLPYNDLNFENFNRFAYFVQTLIISQDAESPFYSDDTFYSEFEAFSNHSESKTICVENSDEVPCLPSVSEVTYNIGQSGCRDGEFRITFGSGFYAPFGLDRGSKIKVNWEFGPLGKSGFWLIPIKNKKAAVTGRTKTVGCFNFGSKNELTLSITINDHESRKSNTSQIIIEKPKTKFSGTSIESNATYFESLSSIE